MSSKSVQSFMIDICHGPPIENGLHNVCLARCPVPLPSLYRPDSVVVKEIAIGVGVLRFDSRAGQIGQDVANGSRPLR